MGAAASGGDNLMNLTRRDIQVLVATSEGLRNKEIAEKLGVTEGVIKTHKFNLHLKLNIDVRSFAVLGERVKGCLAS